LSKNILLGSHPPEGRGFDHADDLDFSFAEQAVPDSLCSAAAGLSGPSGQAQQGACHGGRHSQRASWTSYFFANGFAASALRSCRSFFIFMTVAAYQG